LCSPRNILCPQKLALTSPTIGSNSVGIVYSRTQATESVCLLLENKMLKNMSVLHQKGLSKEETAMINLVSINMWSFLTASVTKLTCLRLRTVFLLDKRLFHDVLFTRRCQWIALQQNSYHSRETPSSDITLF
jgi:hypothetical protein